MVRCELGTVGPCRSAFGDSASDRSPVMTRSRELHTTAQIYGLPVEDQRLRSRVLQALQGHFTWIGFARTSFKNTLIIS
ncbi:hypothetical protein SETIT_5G381000v2 [Setaria italica]|uniref:Uncharacterized protein n=1 Tax=Setaria italica TaxID=4555 RepID=A0A368RD45_SETIT|nr:hypothetical protein SETIT_5G381000v2 [Setaria italica]